MSLELALAVQEPWLMVALTEVGCRISPALWPFRYFLITSGFGIWWKPQNCTLILKISSSGSGRPIKISRLRRPIVLSSLVNPRLLAPRFFGRLEHRGNANFLAGSLCMIDAGPQRDECVTIFNKMITAPFAVKNRKPFHIYWLVARSQGKSGIESFCADDGNRCRHSIRPPTSQIGGWQVAKILTKSNVKVLTAWWYSSSGLFGKSGIAEPLITLLVRCLRLLT